jgi:hypothetical protein|tara:strand:- start:581 stop:1417 length:837 start_codon:yes stop_codon:yes gene_type:complete
MNFLFKKRLVKMNYLANILSIIVLGYFALLISTYIFQRNLLYHPKINNYYGHQLSVAVEKTIIKTQDNVELLSWYHNKNLNSDKTLLFLHGNAGSLENRIEKLNHFGNMKLNFLIVAWRGFNGNKGKPTEKGLYEDARSAIKWLNSKGITEKSIIIYGESLGTGVAIEISQNKNFAGVILEAPFTSMTDVGKDKYPFLPVSLLLKDKYESDKKIKNVKSPILVMHGKVDNIVPLYMGKKIYKLANEPKHFFVQEYGDHMMDYDERLLNELKKFIQSLN